MKVRGDRIGLGTGGEYDENVERLNFQSTEVDAIYDALKPLEEAAAKERQGRGPIVDEQAPGNFPGSSGGRVRDKIGAFAGLSGRSVEKIHQVCEAARAKPEKFGDLPKLHGRVVISEPNPDCYLPASISVSTPSAPNTRAAMIRIVFTGSLPASRSPITTAGMFASIIPSVVPATTG